MSPEPQFDDDNPEWTEADFARAKPLSAFPELEAALRHKPGRPQGTTRSDRQQVTLRLPTDVIEHFKRGGRAGKPAQWRHWRRQHARVDVS